MLGGINIWQLLIILVIVMLLFGTKRLRSLGSDLGSALRGFRKGLSDDEPERLEADPPGQPAESSNEKSRSSES